MKVVALDPGGTTGWAAFSIKEEERVKHLKQPQLFLPGFYCGQFLADNHHADLYNWLEFESVSDFTIVCESFEFRQNRQRDNINLISKEYIGVTKHFGQEYNVPVVFQTAAAAKSFVTDTKLKQMNLYAPGYPHAMDAMRHLVFYLVKEQKMYDLVKCWK